MTGRALLWQLRMMPDAWLELDVELFVTQNEQLINGGADSHLMHVELRESDGRKVIRLTDE